MALDFEDPDVKQALDAALSEKLDSAISEATKELKSKNEELIGEKRKLQENLSKFEGIDLERIKVLQSRLENDEEAKLLADGKMDEVFNRRFEKFRNEYEGKIGDLSKELESAKKNESFAVQRANTTIVEVNLRRAAEVAGVLPTAIDDVINRGLDRFSVDPDGTIVQRDESGKLITIDGKTATPDIWLADLQERAPHFWPASEGTPQGGSGGVGGRSNLEEQMAKAASKGDMEGYRKIRAKMRENS